MANQIVFKDIKKITRILVCFLSDLQAQNHKELEQTYLQFAKVLISDIKSIDTNYAVNMLSLNCKIKKREEV